MTSYFEQELREDQEVVEALIRKNGLFFRYTSPKFFSNKELVLQTIKNEGKDLQHFIFSNHYKGIDNVLSFIADDLKEDREVVLESVKKDGWSICFKEIVNESIKGGGYQFLQQEFKKDRKIVYKAFKHSETNLELIDESLKKDSKFISKVFRNNKLPLPAFDIDKSLTENKEQALAIVKKSCSFVSENSTYLARRFRYYVEAVKQNANLFGHTSKELRGDQNFYTKRT